MKQFLQWLGGADPEVLERAPSAGNAAAGLGGTVLTTGVMATAAFAMATHDWLHFAWIVAGVVGVGWGFAIMNLDRWLLIATRRQATPLLTMLQAVPRIVLAIVIGCVIAEPLVLRIFESEVTLQAKQDRLERRDASERALDRAFADIPKLEGEQGKLQRTLESGPAVAFAGNPDYDAARRRYEATQEKLAKAEQAVGCEAEGTCGTGRSGCGPVCAANRRVAAQRQHEARRAEGELNAVAARLRRDGAIAKRQSRRFATPELGRVNEALKARRAEKAAKLKKIESDFATPMGAIDRMEALDHLSKESAVVTLSTWLFRLFLVAVDITPILFKNLQLTGRPSPYERAQEELDEREFARLKTAEEAEDGAHRIHLRLIAEEAEIQVGHRRASLEEMHEKIAETEREVWRAQIDGWSRAVHPATPADQATSTNGSA